jgi:hypothetical protein
MMYAGEERLVLFKSFQPFVPIFIKECELPEETARQRVQREREKDREKERKESKTGRRRIARERERD